MTESDVYSRITPIFRSTLDNATLVLHGAMTTKDIPRLDSFRYVDIILQIEEALNIRIRPREANAVKNIGDLVALVQSKLTT